MPAVPREGRSGCQGLGAAAGLRTESSGPEWQGQLSAGTEGHGQVMPGSLRSVCQVLLSSPRVWLLLVFLTGLVREVKM